MTFLSKHRLCAGILAFVLIITEIGMNMCWIWCEGLGIVQVGRLSLVE